jgi:hypothetical protein
LSCVIRVKRLGDISGKYNCANSRSTFTDWKTTNETTLQSSHSPLNLFESSAEYLTVCSIFLCPI